MSDWIDIEEAVEQLYGSVPTLAGEADEKLAQAETRLGIPLPHLLRQFYLRFGRYERITSSQDQLLPPEALSIRSGALVFCRENQGVCWWGIRCPDVLQQDPPVYASDYQANWKWDTDHLSDFLIRFVYWQAVSGGLPNTAAGRTQKATALLAEENWREVRFGKSEWDMRVFVAAGQAICLGAGWVNAATRHPEDLWTVGRLLEVEWDHVETEDEDEEIA